VPEHPFLDKASGVVGMAALQQCAAKAESRAMSEKKCLQH
jgi:hypothetical protein